MFISFQIVQTHYSQIQSIKDRRDPWKPFGWINCTKLSAEVPGFIEESLSQSRIRYHTLPKKLQRKKRWSADSSIPHPPTHKTKFAWIILRLSKLSFVGRRLRNKRQAKSKTFKGTCLCHILSHIKRSPTTSFVVKNDKHLE